MSFAWREDGTPPLHPNPHPGEVSDLAKCLSLHLVFTERAVFFLKNFISSAARPVPFLSRLLFPSWFSIIILFFYVFLSFILCTIFYKSIRFYVTSSSLCRKIHAEVTGPGGWLHLYVYFSPFSNEQRKFPILNPNQLPYQSRSHIIGTMLIIININSADIIFRLSVSFVAE